MKKECFLLISILFFSITGILSQSISGGGGGSLFLCSDNLPMACGYNQNGSVGDGSSTDRHVPVQVLQLDSIIAVSSGGDHSLFLKSDGTVWACGSNQYGRLGDGTATDRHLPVKVLNVDNIIAISSGDDHSLFLRNDGTVYACGGNENGQLGDGTTADRLSPILLDSISNVIAISAGSSYSLFLKNDGTVWGTGYNSTGQLADATPSPTVTQFPLIIPSLNGIIAISAGGNHSLFLKNDSTVWASGANSNGQLGDGTSTPTLTNPPIYVSSLSDVQMISAGKYHSLFLKSDGSVWSCGYNNDGELGDGSFINKHLPVQVLSLDGIISVDAGMYHSTFLRQDGSVFACGNNGYGKLGDGTTTQRNVPVPVLGLCNFVSIPEDLSDYYISIFPNPTNNIFTITTNLPIDSKSEIQIYNDIGQPVKFSSLQEAGNYSINTEAFENGSYIISIMNNGLIWHRKLIVNH